MALGPSGVADLLPLYCGTETCRACLTGLDGVILHGHLLCILLLSLITFRGERLNLRYDFDCLVFSLSSYHRSESSAMRAQAHHAISVIYAGFPLSFRAKPASTPLANAMSIPRAPSPENASRCRLEGMMMIRAEKTTFVYCDAQKATR